MSIHAFQNARISLAIDRAMWNSSRPTVSTNGAAVVFGTLHGAAPALCVAVAGRKRRDGLAVHLNGLRVVPAGAVELVCPEHEPFE